MGSRPFTSAGSFRAQFLVAKRVKGQNQPTGPTHAKEAAANVKNIVCALHCILRDHIINHQVLSTAAPIVGICQ